ncbi:PBECR2 nuclease fold domain-containing protein [Halarcobacter anaerophilus]|uniref:Phage-Barnase-EndoU-ColicinE5/D-RelE like nuclease 2 domain-containing protein n=1 Tax=Halarcobacter anaerophilus TaxID=877500 RepID=A0A4Q0Y4E5_9BACT|nr:PBECR2 nuclease fold domain-containing protein [Halarcobacter anaerophilus]QDF28964.1 glycine zipper 2TM domain-containing protein [Halarcobacter anaerophilus]RXJ63599.1 hypothetical protein CRV06_05245 [Halarcobacter anaerophilus]
MQIDIFNNKEFQALPQEEKQTIVTNYFNKELADDEYKSLADDKKSTILNNFVNSQINPLVEKKDDKTETVQNVDINIENSLNKEEVLNRTITPPENNQGYQQIVNQDKPLETDVIPIVDNVLNSAADDVINSINPKDETQKEKKATEVLSHIQNVQFANKDLADMVKGFTGDDEALKNIQDKALQTNKAVVDTLYSIGINAIVDGNGEVKFKDDDGKFKTVGDDFWESLKEDISNNKYEIVGDIAGGAAGNRLTKKYLDSISSAAKIGGWRGKVAEFIGTLGGAAIGAFTGRAADVENSKDELLNMVDDLQKATNLKEVIDQNPTLQKALDGANMTIYGTAITSAVAEPIIKVGGRAIRLPKQAKDYVVNGNINGARDILKKDLKIDEQYIDDALRQAKENYQEVIDYTNNAITGKTKQQEQLLAATLEKGDANIIKGAIAKNETAARNLSDTIDQRTTTIQKNLDNNSSKIGGEEIKNYLNNYESQVKSDFIDMRKSFSDAFKETNYRFDLEDLNLNSVFRDMSKRVQDPDAKKRFQTLQTSIKNTIYDSNAQVGIDRDINGLLDLRQQLNRFYGQNEKYLTNKKDKDVFNSLKENIDNQIHKAVNDNLPEDVGTRLLDSFSKSMQGYRELGALSDNNVFKGIMGDAQSSEYRMDKLIKHMADDDSYVDDVLSKMSPNTRQTVEVAVIRDITDSFTAKTAQGQKAIAFEDLAKKLEGIKRNVRSQLGKETIDNLITYADKFGNKDLLYLDMAKGIKTKPKHNIATTLEGKIKMETANMFFQFIQSIKPGDDAKRLALQRHIASALERSRTPKEFATSVYEYPELADDSKQILRGLIKENNKILNAKNNVEAERLLKEAEQEKNRLFQIQQKIDDEIANFTTPSIAEIRAVESYTPDDKYGSFSQMTAKITRGTATPNEIEQYVKAKNKIDPKVLEAKVLENRYPISNEAITKLEDLKAFDSNKVNEILNDNEFNSLIYNLKQNKLPNTTKTMEDKFRDKFYELNKLYDNSKEDITKAKKTKDNLILGENRLIENNTVNNYLDNDFDIYRHLPYNDENWVKEFNLKSKDDTAIVRDILGNEVKISKNAADKIEKNNREHYFGLIKPTVENPTMILKHKDAEVYIKRFYDEEMKKYSIYSVTKDYGNNEVYLSSIVHRRDNQLVNKIREGEITYLNHGTVDGTPSSRATSPIQSTESLNENIIPNNTVKNQEIELPRELVDEGYTISDIGEFIDPEGKVLFSNAGTILAGGFTGGSETAFNQHDWNGDGEVDQTDILYGTIAGAIGLTTFKKKFPKLFENGNNSDAVIGSFAGKAPLGAIDNQGFYSTLEKVVDEKVGGKIDSVSLTKMLEKNSVKQDELEWSGLKDLIENNEKLTKEQIQQTLDDNRLVIEKLDNKKTKYGDYKISGGENYRELLFKTPKVPGDYTSQHWDESNIITFTRVDDRSIDNKKTLFLEELQSDWHQAGRKYGYEDDAKIAEVERNTEDIFTKYDMKFNNEITKKEHNQLIKKGLSAEENNTLNEYIKTSENLFDMVPDAPFKKNWAELGFKRMIQEAVSNDYEKIAWTTGQQQTKRYSLEKQLDTIVYNKQTGYIQGSKAGDEVIFKKVASDKEVEGLLGKELTQRLIDPKSSTRDEIFVLKGDELKFGGDGMKGFYDNIVPNIAKKLFKKYKVKPKMEELDDIEQMVWSIDITPAMKEDIKKYGQPLYMIGGTVVGLEALNNGAKDE